MHHIRTEGMAIDLTALAWNAGSDAISDTVSPLMFATGSSDGIVRIWTAETPAEVKMDGMLDGLAPLRSLPAEDAQEFEDPDDSTDVIDFGDLHWLQGNPHAFSRPVDYQKPFTPFESFQVQDMSAFNGNIPRAPKILRDHDIEQADWMRFMQVHNF